MTSECCHVGSVSVDDTTYFVVSLKNGAPGSSSAVRVDHAGSNISYVVRPSRMPRARFVSSPIASPIFGSNPYSNVHVGASMTPSRVMNSCTWISPTADLPVDPASPYRRALGTCAGPHARERLTPFPGTVLSDTERVLVAHSALPLPVLSWWRRCLYGNRNRQVVQRREGVWVHHPCGRWQGRVRPPFVDRRGRLQVARRGRAGAVRRGRGREGPRGEERRRRLVAAAGHAARVGAACRCAERRVYGTDDDRRSVQRDEGVRLMGRRSPQSAVKRAREQALREKRELKQAKKDARAAERRAAAESPEAIDPIDEPDAAAAEE